MSSTSSTNGRGSVKDSATEALASRYRHLFVLPSTGLLLAYAGAITLVLCLIADWASLVLVFVLSFSVFVLSTLAVSNALQVENSKTIASAKRVVATLMAGEAIWLLCAACGGAYALATGSHNALTDALLFGAFVCAGIEFLIINGVFTKSAPLSLVLAAVYPASTFAVIRLNKFSSSTGIGALVIGSLAFVVIGAFIPLLKGKKTSQSQNSLDLFRSFMRTWVGGEAQELEGVIGQHAETVSVTTKVMRFKTPGDNVFVVMPGIHPGPFYPLGSYDLPGVISHAFKDTGQTMTLHRPGGHERNLVSAAETERYAEGLKNFSSTIPTSPEGATVRGPLNSHIGKATVTSWAIARDLVTAISFAPLGSDDISSEVEEELGRQSAEEGFESWVVDAHNSITDGRESPDTRDSGWRRFFKLVGTTEARQFRAAYSHSKELDFHPHGDLTENGVGLLMLEAAGTKWVLVLADSNNAVPALRLAVSDGLRSAGYQLMEFCTSDTHNLAARGLTVARGYKALGEETPVNSIVELVLRLAGLAESKLGPCSYGSGRLTTEEKTFGSVALEEFAAITQSSSDFAKRYSRFAVVSVVLLLVGALLV